MNRNGIVFLCICMFVLALVTTLGVSANAGGADRVPLRFEIQTVPGVERYVDFLAYPSYLVVALENNGIKPINSGRVTIVDGGTLRFKGGLFRFLGKQGTVYKYVGIIEWDIGPTQVKFKIPAELDTAMLSNGRLIVKIYPPLSKLFPEALVGRFRLKAQAMANAKIQKKMLDYFDRLTMDGPVGLGQVRAALDQILVRAYNIVERQNENISCVTREPGDAEPLSDQLLLLITLAIWFFAAPLAILLLLYFQRRYRSRRL